MSCTPLGSETPFLALCKPGSLEAVNWAATINNNWDLIDAFASSIAGGPTVASGGYGVRGLSGQNNGANPNTVYDVTADLAVFRVPSTNVVAVATTVSVSVNTGVSGAGGMDTGAVAASTWYHLYLIRHPTGPVIGAVLSLAAPPTGPTLSAGYTAWAYAGALRVNASTQILPTRMRGPWMSYFAHQGIVSAGAPAAGVETAVNLATLVPPNAEQVRLDFWAEVTNSVACGLNLRLREIAGQDASLSRGYIAVAAGNGALSGEAVIANNSQAMLYLWEVDTGTPSAPSVTIFVKGYSVPNAA